MITFVLVGAAIFVVIGLTVLVMASGAKGKRHGQAAGTVVADQEQTNPRKDVRSGTGLN